MVAGEFTPYRGAVGMAWEGVASLRLIIVGVL